MSNRLLFLVGVAALTVCPLIYGLERADLVSLSPIVSVCAASGYAVWIVAILVWLQISLGRRILQLIPAARVPDEIATVLFRFAAGLFLTISILTLFAFVRQLNLLTILLYLTVAGLAAFFGRRRETGELPDNERRLKVPVRWQTVAVVLAIVVWLLPYAAHVLLPNIDHDSLLFHFPFAERLITHGLWTTDPMFEANNYPGGIHLVYAVLNLLGAEHAIVPFNLVCTLAIPLAAYGLATSIWDRGSGRLAGLTCATVAILWGVAISARIDTFLTLFFMLAVYAFLLWRKSPELHGLLAVIGMSLGLAMGVKYTAVFLVAVLMPLVVCMSLRDRAVLKTSPLPALALALLFLVFPSSLWYVRNAVELRDPLYPLLAKNRLYKDTDGTLVSYGTEVRRVYDLAPQAEEVARGLRGTPFEFLTTALPAQGVAEPPANLLNLWNAYREPWRYARKPRHIAGPFVLLFFLLPLAARDRYSCWLYLIGGAVFLIIGSQTYLMRYMMPVLPLFAVGAARVVTRADEVVGQRMTVRRPWISCFFAVVMALFLGRLAIQEFAELRGRGAERFFVGAESSEDWIARVKFNEADLFPDFARYMAGEIRDGRLAEPASVLMIGEGRGCLLPCDYVPDMSWNARPWLAEVAKADGDPARIPAQLRAQGVDHIMVNVRWLEGWSNYRLGTSGRSQLAFSMFRLKQLIDGHATVVAQRDGVILAQLNDAPAARIYGETSVPTSHPIR